MNIQIDIFDARLKSISINIENRSVEFLCLSILSISVFKWLILSILIEKCRKHKKHNHSTSQHTYCSLVQLRMKKEKSDSRQICDYRFLSIIITNQSTNIECYRLLSINQLRFWWSISINLWRAVNYNVGAQLAQDSPYKL